MQDGNRHLHQWLCDQVRQGLASLQSQPTQYWDDFAALMVDFKMGAISRRIHRIKEQLKDEVNGLGKLADEIAELYLFSQGLRRIQELPAEFDLDLMQIGGMSLKKEEILSNAGKKDYWLVLGVREHNEDKLKVRRTWLLGESTGSFAMVLDFAWGFNTFEQTYRPGSAFMGEAIYYPGNVALRAVFRMATNTKVRTYDTPAGVPNFRIVAERFSMIIAKNPWLHSFPFLINDVIPIFENNTFKLIDCNGMAIQFKGNDNMAGWKAIAVSGHCPIDVAGEWDGHQFHCLSIFNEGRLISL